MVTDDGANHYPTVRPSNWRYLWQNLKLVKTLPLCENAEHFGRPAFTASGVPQGSVLRPLFLSPYDTSLRFRIHGYLFSRHFMADDTQFMKTKHLTKTGVLFFLINACVQQQF